MARIKETVFDAGPFMHLEEIKKFNLVQLFIKILTTNEVIEECREINKIINNFTNIINKNLTAKSKDFAKYILEEYNIDLGEATAIALCKQENINLFFTNDIEAKQTAYSLGFEAHGTLAILLRSYRENLLTKEEVKSSVNDLYNNSTLFLTKELMEWTMKEIENFVRKV